MKFGRLMGVATLGMAFLASAGARQAQEKHEQPAHALPLPQRTDALLISGRDFERIVLQADKPVLVELGAEWCGPCRIVKPAMAQLAEELKGQILVVRIDDDELQASRGDDNPIYKLAAENNVPGIPAFFLFSKGRLVDIDFGVEQGADADGWKAHIKKWIADSLAEANKPKAPVPKPGA